MDSTDKTKEHNSLSQCGVSCEIRETEYARIIRSEEPFLYFVIPYDVSRPM